MVDIYLLWNICEMCNYFFAFPLLSDLLAVTFHLSLQTKGKQTVTLNTVFFYAILPSNH